MMCGGTGDAKPVDEETRSICDQVRSDLETKAGCKFAEYTPIVYKTQVVAGTNFFVKIHVGNGDHVHVRIFRPLGANPLEVHSHQAGKTKEDALEYF